MILNHVAGDTLFVDLAGKMFSCANAKMGEIVECRVFVAGLPFSDLAFAKAVHSQCSPDFTHALVRWLNTLDGAPSALASDNSKAAVSKTGRCEPNINRALET